MISEEVLKKIFDIAKSTEKLIKEHKADKTLTSPIDSDFIKTAKAMGYEKMLSEVKLYASSKKN